MNQKTKWKEFIILIAYTVSFWGIFYPNFSLTRDVCVIRYEDDVLLVDENGQVQKWAGEELSEEDYEEFLAELPESTAVCDEASDRKNEPVTYMELHNHKVTYKFKIVEWIKNWFK